MDQSTAWRETRPQFTSASSERPGEGSVQRENATQTPDAANAKMTSFAETISTILERFSKNASFSGDASGSCVSSSACGREPVT